LYDVKTGDEAAAFDAQGPVQSLSFSENGTWLASVSRGQSGASVWDLRKTAIIKELNIGSPATAAKWDYTGQFLAVGGTGGVTIQHYAKSGKKWSEPFSKAVSATAVAWGANAQSLLALTEDGAVNILGAAN
jgi:pre-mRNA-processing factor 19